MFVQVLWCYVPVLVEGNVSAMATSGSAMTLEQARCAYLSYRCGVVYSKKDKDKNNPIPEGKALAVWNEILDQRFPQPKSGGQRFVLKILRIVNNSKTDEGLDIVDKPSILERLAQWSEGMLTKMTCRK